MLLHFIFMFPTHINNVYVTTAKLYFNRDYCIHAILSLYKTNTVLFTCISLDHMGKMFTICDKKNYYFLQNINDLYKSWLWPYKVHFYLVDFFMIQWRRENIMFIPLNHILLVLNVLLRDLWLKKLGNKPKLEDKVKCKCNR